MIDDSELLDHSHFGGEFWELSDYPAIFDSPAGVTKEDEEGASQSSKGKGKSEKSVKVHTKRKGEEDLCFVCFGEGNLVRCDHRGCPKAYHPTCVNLPDTFFQAEKHWTCGRHICRKCEKTAQYMCYTCTFSLCKSCIKGAEFSSVRGTKGFCQSCMRIVLTIEKNKQEKKEMSIADFDGWEYLFKDYWLNLKGKLSLTMDELNRAKNISNGSTASACNEDTSVELCGDDIDPGSSFGHVESSMSSRAKEKKRSRPALTDKGFSSPAVDEGTPVPEDGEWASKELLDFVSHVKDGDTSVLTQCDVQALLVEYIERNQLSDPRRKSHIICDSRFMNLFGKARVGRFEMVRLLERHFLKKRISLEADDGQEGIGNSLAIQMKTDGNIDSITKKTCKRPKHGETVEERAPQTNLDDYAAVDVHNINQIYLTRTLVEDLLEELDTLQDKIIGAFVRIRVSDTIEKQDLYKLVKVVGTTKAADTYKIGKRTTDIRLEILDLDKTEIIPVDAISYCEFSQEECRRVRQDIESGLLSPLKVGEVQEKARALQEVRVNHWMKTETLRLSHRRDRANEKGRRKEVKDCVEKLQLLSTPEERSRRLRELPEVHADLTMKPESNGKGETHDKEGTGTWKTFTDQEQNGDIIVGGASLGKEDSLGADERATEEVSHTNSRDNVQENQATINSKHVIRTSNAAAPSSSNTSKTEKMWCYQDPAGKVQGPFSMTQLRKWSTAGYFPADLRIWKKSERQENSILLTDELEQFQRGSSDIREDNREGGWGGTQSHGEAAQRTEEGGKWTDNIPNSSSAPDNRENNWEGGWGGTQSHGEAAQRTEEGKWTDNIPNSSSTPGNRENNWEGGWGGTESCGGIVQKAELDGGWSEKLKNSSSASEEGAWGGTQSYGGAAQKAEMVGKWTGDASQGQDLSMDGSSNAWCGQSQSCYVKSPPATDSTTKSSTWSPVATEAFPHSDNTSLTSSDNWKLPSSNLATDLGATLENSKKNWASPEGTKSTPGWGAMTQGNSTIHENINEVCGPSEGKTADMDWGASVHESTTSWTMVANEAVTQRQNTSLASSDNWKSPSFSPESGLQATAENSDKSLDSPKGKNSNVDWGSATQGNTEGEWDPPDGKNVNSAWGTAAEGNINAGRVQEPVQNPSFASAGNWKSESPSFNPETSLRATSENSEKGWGSPEGKNSNTGCDIVTPVSASASASTGWETTQGNTNGGCDPTEGKNAMSAQGTAAQGNINAGWGQESGQNTPLASADNWKSPSFNPQTNGNSKKGLGSPEGKNSNTGCGTVTQGRASTGWETTQGNTKGACGPADGNNAKSAWGTAAQRNINMGWGQQATKITSLDSSDNWKSSSFSPETGLRATTENSNQGWGSPEGNNSNTGWRTGTVGSASTGWETTPQGNAKGGWNSPGGQNANSSWGTSAQGNRNTGWGQQAGRGRESNDYGQSGGRKSWNGSSSGRGRGSSGPPDRAQRICKFHQSGNCKKGTSCGYLHS